MTHEQHRDIALLGYRDERTGHGPHLGDAPGTALDLSRGDGLNRVHHQQGGTGRLHVPQQGPQLGLRGQEQPGIQGVDALGPQPHLRGRLLTGDVEDRSVPAFARHGGGLRGDVEQERGLADAGLTGQQHDGTRHDPAAQDPVQLAHARRARRSPFPVHVADRQGRAARHRR